MFGDVSAVEWKAREEKLDNRIAETRYQIKDRKLQREIKKLSLEDLDDRLLDISISDKGLDVSIAEEKFRGKQTLLDQARNNTRYLEGKHLLQQNIWALDLASDELQIASTKRKVEEMRRATKELGLSIDNKISQMIGGF
jgi:hypothetical protein